RSPERVNRRNGYRERGWEAGVGSVELRVRKAQGGLVLPRLAAAAAPQGGAGVRVGDRRCLRRRLLDPTGREAGAAARRRADVEEPALAASEEPRGAARVAAPSTSASCAPSASTVTASVSRSASTSSPPRTAPPGSRSSVVSSPAALPAYGRSARTPSQALSTRSRPA